MRILQRISSWAGFVLAVTGWLAYYLTLGRPARKLLKLGQRAMEQIEGLSAGLAKLATGDLAARISLSSNGQAGAIGGELSLIAGLVAELESAVRESAMGFNSITDEPCNRLCYVGSDSYAEGRACGEALGELLKGSGSVAIIVGNLQAVNHELRRKGVLAYLSEKHPDIKDVETVETFEEPRRTYDTALDLLKRYRDLSAIYVTEGNTPSAAARAVVDAGREGKTIVIAHDLTEATMEYVARGVIGATISQDPYAQGHDPVVRLFNSVVEGWRPAAPRLLTKLESVTGQNYRRFWDPKDGAGVGDRSRLAAPVQKRANHLLRIAVVSMSGEGFWRPVKQGALDAGRELEGLNAHVTWIEPPHSGEDARAASTYQPILKQLVAEGYDCIALPIFDRKLVSEVNDIIRGGVAVATFNSEPVSLREMFSSVSSHADRVISLSQDLAASAEQSGQSTAAIGETMGRITETLKLEVSEVDRTGGELKTLLQNVEKVDKAAGESAEMARRVVTASRDGLSAVTQMRRTVGSLQEASSIADGAIKALNEDTKKIGAIVAAIGELANQTNVLAINASIQAARAGEQGKGFAVIAGEIRQLAEQSNKLAGDIEALIGGVQLRVASAVEATDRGLKQARENAESAEVSEHSLTDISSLAVENERRMKVIFEAVEEMSRFSRKIESTVRSLTEANAKSGGAAEEVSASTREMSAQAMGVAKAAQSLLEMAKGQLVLLSQFRLKG